MRKFCLIILFGLITSLLAIGETISPDYEGWCQPPGWMPRKALAKPKVGIALSGGGLRGLCQIGILKQLEEAGIGIDCIAGVSMGGIVGAMYASGYSPVEIQNIVRKIDWGDIFLDKPSRRTLFLTRKRTYGRHLLQIRFRGFKPYIPPAITSGQKISFLLDDLLMQAIYRPEPDFDHLKYPFRTVATDLNSGEKVIFKSGDLGQALRATSSFPIVFSPVKLGKQSLVDGGVVENIPVSTLRSMGAEKVLAVEASSALTTNVNEPWEIVNQITTIMMAPAADNSIDSADMVMKPVPDSIGAFEFTAIETIIKSGEQGTRDHIGEIKKLLSDPVSEDTICILPEFIEYTVIGSLELEAEDEIKSGELITRSELKSHLTRLYSKYELLDIRAEINDDTVKIMCTCPPAFRYISLSGNNLVPDSLILKQIRTPSGAPVVHSRGIADKEGIIRFYRNSGYSLASIKESFLRNDTLFIKIDEGVISELGVAGGPKNKLLDLGLREGTVFNWNKVKKGINRLYGTDLYETVRLSVEPSDGGHKVKLLLDRRPFPLIRMGQRYDLERGWGVFGEFLTADVHGTGNDLTLYASPGSKDQKYGVEIGSDRLLHTYISINGEFYYRKNEYSRFNQEHQKISDYNYEQLSGLFRFGQLISRWGLLSAAVKVEETNSNYISERDREQRDFCLILESAVDTYDRYPFPHSGENLKVTFQTTSEIVPKGELPSPALKYSKIYGDFQRWTPLAKRYTFFMRVRGGYAERPVPSWEKFSLGGLNDFGGLQVREVLGNRLIAGSAGLRFDLLSRFLAEAFITARYDLAQITDGAQLLEFKRAFFRHGTNLSLALNTRLGPVEIAWGWAAPYKDIPENHCLYFSIGYEF